MIKKLRTKKQLRAKIEELEEVILLQHLLIGVSREIIENFQEEEQIEKEVEKK